MPYPNPIITNVKTFDPEVEGQQGIAKVLSTITKENFPNLRILSPDTFMELIQKEAVLFALQSPRRGLFQIVGMVRYETRGLNCTEICGVWSKKGEHAGNGLMEGILSIPAVQQSTQFLVTRKGNSMRFLAEKWGFEVLPISAISHLQDSYHAAAKNCLYKDKEDHASGIGKLLMIRGAGLPVEKKKTTTET